MYFLEQRKKFTTPNILGGRSFPVPTWRWKQIAASEDKNALEEHLERIIEQRVKSEHSNEWDIRREYKIISNEQPCNRLAKGV